MSNQITIVSETIVGAEEVLLQVSDLQGIIFKNKQEPSSFPHVNGRFVDYTEIISIFNLNPPAPRDVN